MTTPDLARAKAGTLRRAADFLDPTFVPTPSRPGFLSRDDRVCATAAIRDHADQLDRIADALSRGPVCSPGGRR